MKIGPISLPSPYVVAPMAGMTDTAFRRLVKRQGGCGLVVTEMVSSEGLVRGIDRTLEYAEYTEEERPVSIQIFGGDPEKMAKAVRIPVTVKMRAGWDEHQINAPELARRMEDAGAAAVTVHGRTAAQSYSGFSDWSLIGRVAQGVRIPVIGSGDCLEAAHLVERLSVGGV